MKFRTILLGLSALFVAANAAFFSVYGLSRLFAGAPTAIIIMASSLELAKLIAASFLYNYWSRINKILRGYLLVGVFILITITSAGIYGFLTSAYQTTADQLSITSKRIEVVNLKKSRYEVQLKSYNLESTQLNNSINELSKGLSNNVIQYTDSTGRLITTTSSATRRVLNNQLNDFKKQRNKIGRKMEELNDSITSLDLQILNINTTNTLSAEVGPLKYIAAITGIKMNKIVNWFALFIIFVFDPLAVTLIVSFNTAVRIDKESTPHGRKKKIKPLYTDTSTSNINNINVVDEDVIQPTPIEKLDINNDGIITEDEIKVNYENGAWKNSHNGAPYYTHPWFNWDKPSRWINNSNAVSYWLTTQGGSQRALDNFKKEAENK